MTQSTLGTEFAELEKITGDYLNWGRSDWDAATTERLDEIIKSAYRRYLAGRPLDGKLQPLGDFNEWRLIREALVWLGEEDPALTVDTAMALDPDLETLRRVLTLWHAAFGSSPMTVTRIGQEQFDEETPAAQLKRLMAESWCQGKPWTGQKISAELRKRSGRVAGEMRLAKAGEIGGIDAWRVETVQTTDF